MDEDDDWIPRNATHDSLCTMVAGITGFLAALASPFALAFGFASGMVFDAPGADRELLPWIVFLSFNMLTIILVWMVIFAFGIVKNPSLRRLRRLFEPLGLLAVVFLGIWLFAPG